MTENNPLSGLRVAAKAVLGREPSQREIDTITEEYGKASGTPYDKAIRGLSRVLGESEGEVREKAASSDNTNRKVVDLATTLQSLTK